MGFSGVICSFLTMPICAESWRLFRAVPAWLRTVRCNCLSRFGEVVNVVHRLQRAHGVSPLQPCAACCILSSCVALQCLSL